MPGMYQEFYIPISFSPCNSSAKKIITSPILQVRRLRHRSLNDLPKAIELVQS